MKPLNIIVGTLMLSILFYSCDKNEFSPEIADQEFSIEENSPSGSTIGTVVASDLDEGQILSFEIIDGNTDGTFEIHSSTGILSIDNPAELDFEKNMQFSLTVSVSDGHKKDPLESSSGILIVVTDQNEFAPVIESQTYNLDENPAVGMEIGTITATDEDIHQILSYSILDSQYSMYFDIDPASGIISVKDSSIFDFEVLKQISIEVEVSDNHAKPKTSSAIVSVNINDVLELTDGLVGAYLFNGNTNDQSGNEYNGEVFGAVLTEDRNGSSSEAYSFNGSSDYIKLPNDFDIPYRTISLWFKAENITGLHRMYDNDHAELEYGSVVFDVLYDDQSAKKYLRIINGGGKGDFLMTEVQEGIWYHAAVSVGQDTVKAYLNGILYDEGVVNLHHSVDGYINTFLGTNRGANSYFFEGKIDDVLIHDRVLDDEEVTRLFGEGLK